MCGVSKADIMPKIGDLESVFKRGINVTNTDAETNSIIGADMTIFSAIETRRLPIK